MKVLTAIANPVGNSVPFHTYLLNAHKMVSAPEVVSQKEMKQLSAYCSLEDRASAPNEVASLFSDRLVSKSSFLGTG